jgi:nucleotide-binding universal stress UspA family protein
MIETVGVALKRIFGRQNIEVFPVYILTPNVTSTPIAWFDELAPKIQEDALARLKSLLAQCSFPIAKPTVLVDSQSSMEFAAAKINQFAKSCNASLVLLPKQAKSSLRRFVVGSFAEAMLNHSRVSLLTINPQPLAEARTRRRCLVPVDLESQDCMQTVDRIIEKLVGFSVEILFLNSMPANQSKLHWSNAHRVFDSQKVMETRLAEEKDRRNKLLDELVKRAKSRGIKSKGLLSVVLASPRDVIISTAQEMSSSFIVMASRGEFSGSLFAGSVTRSVIRNAQCPVWSLPTASFF